MKKYKQFELFGIGRMEEHEDGQWVKVEDCDAIAELHESNYGALAELHESNIALAESVIEHLQKQITELGVSLDNANDHTNNVIKDWNAYRERWVGIELRNDIAFWLMVGACVLNVGVIAITAAGLI